MHCVWNISGSSPTAATTAGRADIEPHDSARRKQAVGEKPGVKSVAATGVEHPHVRREWYRGDQRLELCQKGLMKSPELADIFGQFPELRSNGDWGRHGDP